MNKIAFRIDDIGASTKRFEVYSKSRIGNFLFLKYLKPFQAWAPYREMTAQEWYQIFEILHQYRARLTVGITASWVEWNGKLVPFPKKFPEEAKGLKIGLEQGVLEIANHGLTHCVVGKHLPRLFRSNRIYHREFWDWVPRETHFTNIKRSQEILQDYFGVPITTFIPPGNVYSSDTLEAAGHCGIERVNSSTPPPSAPSAVKIVNNENVVDFHDREIVLEGVEWLERKLSSLPEATEHVFVREL